MDKERILAVLKELRKDAKKRKFSQSVEIIFNLQDLDFKKPSDQLDFFVTLPHTLGKKLKVCGLVAPELQDESKRICDFTVGQLDFDALAANKKKMKKLARAFDFFIAQANIMPKIAQVFGRYLGPRNKMPNPKIGAVVPPKTNLQPLYEKLQKSVRFIARKSFVVQVLIGNEKMDDNAIVENAYTLIDNVLHHLPKEKNNLKSIYLKFTMSKAIKL